MNPRRLKAVRNKDMVIGWAVTHPDGRFLRRNWHRRVNPWIRVEHKHGQHPDQKQWGEVIIYEDQTLAELAATENQGHVTDIWVSARTEYNWYAEIGDA